MAYTTWSSALSVLIVGSPPLSILRDFVITVKDTPHVPKLILYTGNTSIPENEDVTRLGTFSVVHAEDGAPIPGVCVRITDPFISVEAGLVVKRPHLALIGLSQGVCDSYSAPFHTNLNMVFVPDSYICVSTQDYQFTMVNDSQPFHIQNSFILYTSKSLNYEEAHLFRLNVSVTGQTATGYDAYFSQIFPVSHSHQMEHLH